MENGGKTVVKMVSIECRRKARNTDQDRCGPTRPIRYQSKCYRGDCVEKVGSKSMLRNEYEEPLDMGVRVFNWKLFGNL